MLVRLALATILGVSILGSSARAAGMPYERVRLDREAYRQVTRLETRGYFTGSPARSFAGGRERTRYDFALAVDRLFRSFQDRAVATERPGDLQEDLETLRALVNEFDADLAELGRNTSAMSAELDALEGKIARERAGFIGWTLAQPFGETGDTLTLSLNNRRSQGLRAALRKPFREAVFNDSPLGRSLSGTGAQASVSALAGRVAARVKVDPGDRLETIPGGLPLDDPADATSYDARLSIAMGDYLLHAFYNRDRHALDPARVWSPLTPAGPSDSVGGSVTAILSGSLALELETATIRSLQDEATRTLYFMGGVRLAVGSRLRVLLGYEWLRLAGTPGEIATGAAYVLGVGQEFGSVRVDLLGRYMLNRGSGGLGSGERGGASAITQISVRF